MKNAVENESIKQRRFDTIGAIAISRDGQSAAAVSSGGVALKTPGRIGQAATYGAGCWAEDGNAATTTGTGEQLIKTNFARVLNDCLVNPLEHENLPMAADRAFIRHFMNSRILKEYDVDSRLAGFLAAVRDPFHLTARTCLWSQHSEYDLLLPIFQSEESHLLLLTIQ